MKLILESLDYLKSYTWLVSAFLMNGITAFVCLAHFYNE